MKSNPKKVKSLLVRHAGQFVGMTFVKRTNGKKRDMHMHYKRTPNGPFKFDPDAKALFPTFDVQKGAARFASLDTVEEVRAGGRVYDFVKREVRDREGNVVEDDFFA